MEELVQFTTDNHVGVATLVREKPLNSLTLDTVSQLYGQVSAWLADDDIACILLHSSTERAFCAGADITALYHEIKAGNLDYADAFFTTEYRLDHMLHQADKPIIAWGGGVVMGGGLGLLSGCSHRVGTPDNRIAMPEITIGLFPDAGGTWLLSHMPDHLGTFAGLTGCQLSAGDGLALGILDYVLEHDQKQNVIDGLTAMDWSEDIEENHRHVSHLLETQGPRSDLDGNLLAHRAAVSALIESALRADDFFGAFEVGLDAVDARDIDDWLAGAIQTYRSGSPTTARIFMEQLRRVESMSLSESFQMELAIACQCARHPDFPEGVRALLVDKDRNPQWRYRNATEVPAGYVQVHFEPAWSGAHPLADI